MILYTVKSGEGIVDIASRFETSVRRISVDNDVFVQMPLVEGQVLVITEPKITYTVMHGDTVDGILSGLSLDREELLQNNRDIVGNNKLYPGQELIIDKGEKKFGKVRVISSVRPDTDIASLERILPYLTYLSLRSCTLRSDGSLYMTEDDKAKAVSREHKVMPMLEVLPVSMFRQDWLQVLSGYEILTRVAGNIKQMVLSHGYGGVNLNFGNIPSEYFENYVELVATLKNMLSPWGMEVICTVPKECVLSCDPELLGDAADIISLFPKGRDCDIMDVLEIEDLTRITNDVVESKKIAVCVPMSACDQSLRSDGHVFRSERLSSAQATRLALEKQAVNVYDETNCLAEYRYVDIEMGKPTEHRVIFENPESMYEILCLANEVGSNTLNVFNPDKYFAPFWTMLSSLYNIEKIQ